MKKLLMVFALVIGLLSCGTGEKTVDVQNTENDRVEVVYFHGKQRCPTCMAIENRTREVIDSVFADELQNGTLIFRIVDISTPEGEQLADRYEVSWSSLFVNRWKDGEESRNNMTEFGFANVRNNPDTFKTGLGEKIWEALK